MKKSFLKLFTVALAGVVIAASISGCETARDEYIEKIAKEIAVNLVVDVIDASNIKTKEMSK